MATTPTPKLTEQQELAKKYNIIPCPFWMDIGAPLQATLDGRPVPAGTELVFKTPSGIACGAGRFKAYLTGTIMPYAHCYADDPYDPRTTGAIYGEELLVFDGKTGKQLGCSPSPIKHTGQWSKVFIISLWSI